MPSLIQQLLERVYGKTERRVLILGLDAAGKTTVLYKLKLGEVVTTIPTIGFNVETVEFRRTAFTMWDVGGCDKIRPLWRHYYQNTQAIIYVVDSNDRERLDGLCLSVKEDFDLLLNEDELRGIPVLILCNKQDIPGAMTPTEIDARLDFQSMMGGARPYRLQAACATTGDGLYEGLEWLESILLDPNYVAPVIDVPDTSEDEKPLLEQWLEREDEPDDVFIGKLEDLTLDMWDHYTHLRLAWIYLTRHGRRKGKEKIFANIKRFIEESGRTGGKTFHETLTYFWMHMIHYAIAATANPTGEFKVFLLLNPQLSNFFMFEDYYDRDLMLKNPEARAQVILPNKKPLPSLITDISAIAAAKAERGAEEKETTSVGPEVDDDDEGFLERFENGELDRWGHDCVLRLIWKYRDQAGPGNRKEALEKIFAGLKSRQGDGYNETIAYFWINMVDYYRMLVAKNQPTMTFQSYNDWIVFLRNCDFNPQPSSRRWFKWGSRRDDGTFDLENMLLFNEFFSDDVLSSGKSSFVVPDKKPLPAVQS